MITAVSICDLENSDNNGYYFTKLYLDGKNKLELVRTY